MVESGMYRFKDIRPVVNARDLVDVVLSKTQRKTPTEIHKQFKISRIRHFYMRKVKFCQELFREKLNTIINDFPKLDDIHPFYSDLANILYDRDHYKLALGQCNYVSKAVQKIAHDYIKLIKFSSSLYKCKMLKIAAFGRMSKLIKKLQTSLLYLEEVRQHLARLPSINPHSKTIILCGFPNVGKSSFINIVTRANVEVQPYSFTTKNLYIGHFKHELYKYQILDTPGLLDRPLENRNTIEMSAITALAHINAVILFIIDISEDCGYSIKEQVNLFFSIKPLFKNKPIIIGLNKIDKINLDHLSAENKMLIKDIGNNNETLLVRYASFCTLSGVGVEEVKALACDMLKKQNTSLLMEKDELIEELLKEEIKTERKPFIPDSVLKEKLERIEKEKKQKEEEEEKKMQLMLQGNNNINYISEENKENDNTENDNKENEEHNIFTKSLGATIGNLGIIENVVPYSEGQTMREMKMKKKDKSRQSYLSNRKDNKILQIDLQNENGGAGVYSVDIRQNYDIKEEYKYDVIPEIYNGKNIADFVDYNIEEKLLELEKEEEELLAEGGGDVEINPLWFKTEKIIHRMSLRLKGLRECATIDKESTPLYHKRNKKLEEIEKKLEKLDIEKKDIMLKSMMEQPKRKYISIVNDIQKKVHKEICKENQNGNKKKKNKIKAIGNIYNDPTKKLKIYESTSTELQRKRAYKLNIMAYKKLPKGRKSDADRSIPAKKPRHLFSGKRSIGKTSRR